MGYGRMQFALLNTLAQTDASVSSFNFFACRMFFFRYLSRPFHTTPSYRIRTHRHSMISGMARSCL